MSWRRRPRGLRRPSSCGPCDDARPEWPGRRGCACGDGNRASCAGAGCSAGTCACSRVNSFFNEHDQGAPARAGLVTPSAGPLEYVIPRRSGAQGPQELRPTVRLVEEHGQFDRGRSHLAGLPVENRLRGSRALVRFGPSESSPSALLIKHPRIGVRQPCCAVKTSLTCNDTGSPELGALLGQGRSLALIHGSQSVEKPVERPHRTLSTREARRWRTRPARPPKAPTVQPTVPPAKPLFPRC